MALYIQPLSVPRLPQGDFQFQPEVKLFSDYLDTVTLQLDMNTFMEQIVANPDLRYNIENIEFRQGISAAPSVVIYSAMIWFTRITAI